MNGFVVTLISPKPCELNRFLSKFYNKDMKIEEGSFRWTSSFKTALSSSLILEALIDNEEDFKIKALISIGHKENIIVSKENINEIVKMLYVIE